MYRTFYKLALKTIINQIYNRTGNGTDVQVSIQGNQTHSTYQWTIINLTYRYVDC